ncbi:MAG: hypothetical protein WDZ83_11690 [Rhizobiaceae bacterium]
MNMFLKATVTAVSLMVATSAYAASNFEKIDMVKEGVDITPFIVRADSGGYPGYENSNNKHTFSVRVFAKGKGNKNIFAAGIGNKSGMSFVEVMGPGDGDWLFSQWTPTGDDGWGVYKKSIAFDAKPSEIEWQRSPTYACKTNMNNKIAAGKTRSWVLNREWTVQAHALIRFYAAAAPKSSIKKRKFSDGGQTRQKNIVYPVNVKCREAL